MPSVAFQNREKPSFYPLTLCFFLPLPHTEIMCASFGIFSDPEILTEQCLYSQLADNCKCLRPLGHCRGASDGWVVTGHRKGLGNGTLFPRVPLLSVGLLSGMETLHSHGEPVWLKSPWAGAREVKVRRA